MLTLGQARLIKGLLCSAWFGKRLGQSPAGLEPPAWAIKRKKYPETYFKILDPALNQEVHLIQILFLNYGNSNAFI